MTPVEFALWLNGAVGIMDEPPSVDQWEKIKDKLAESLGYMARIKLMEHAEQAMVMKDQEEKRKAYAQRALAGAGSGTAITCSLSDAAAQMKLQTPLRTPRAIV